MTLMKEKQAIELGKIWMKNSVNVGHDYEHASNVEKNALNVLKSLKEEGRDLLGIDSDLVSLAAWWHDSYKARQRKINLWVYLFEGYGSEKIVRRELADYLSSERLEVLAQAVRMHNHFHLYFVLSRNYPSLVQILVEADDMDALSRSRLSRSYKHINQRFVEIAFKLYSFNLVFWWRILPSVSDYAKEFLDNLKRN